MYLLPCATRLSILQILLEHYTDIEKGGLKRFCVISVSRNRDRLFIKFKDILVMSR